MAQKSNWVRFVEVLRWVCVLPVGYMAGMVLRIFLGSLVGLAMQRWWNRQESGLGFWACYAVVMTSQNAAFVLTGTLLAPYVRVATAVTLAGMACLVSLFVHVISRRTVGFSNYRDFAAEALGAILAVAAVVIISRRDRVVESSPLPDSSQTPQDE